MNNLSRPPWHKKASIPKTAAQTVNALKTKIAQMSTQIQQMQDLLEELDVSEVSKKAIEQKTIMETTNSTPPKQSKSKYRPEKIADITERRLQAKHKR